MNIQKKGEETIIKVTLSNNIIKMNCYEMKTLSCGICTIFVRVIIK